MARNGKRTARAIGRKPPVRGPRRGIRTDDVARLTKQALTLCREEFAADWGKSFEKVEREFRNWLAGEVANKADEDAARQVYEKMRKRIGRIVSDLAAFRKGTGLTTGGVGAVSAALYFMEGALERLLDRLGPVRELQGGMAAVVKDERYVRRDGLSALVHRFSQPLYWLDGRTPNYRQLAVIAILVGEAPVWLNYEGRPSTAAEVVAEVEIRVRGLAAAVP